jgi:hypothetical protein
MIRRPARPRRIASVALLGLWGCYGYYPQTTSLAPVGREVQVNLTDSGSFALARTLGPSVVGVQGLLLADSAGSLVVTARGIVQRDGYQAEWRGERIVIPHTLVANTVERRFSRARTTVFSAAIVASLVAIRQAFQGRGAGAGSTGAGPTTPR